MVVHLVKLCVGIDSIAELQEYRDRLQRAKAKSGKAKQGPLEDSHWTRTRPRRAEEVLGGGSLYWVIRGRICVRHRILRLDDVKDEAGKAYCAIVYDPTVIITEARPRRPFRGWRYFEDDEAPPDLADQRAALRAAKSEADLPSAMIAELKSLGLL